MKQKKVLYKSMIKSQFNYCPLVWMFCSRQSNNLTNKIHERFLRISYKDQKTSYHNLLETHNKLTIHQRNLQVLMTEIYKIANVVCCPTNYELSLRVSNPAGTGRCNNFRFWLYFGRKDG